MARFIDWLSTQQNRPDPIGRLSQAAVADPDFPKENDLGFILSYLTQRGANNQLLKTVRKAYSDFEKSIDDFREKVMTKAKDPGKPPKTATPGRASAKTNKAEIKVQEKSAPGNEKPEFIAAPKKTARAKSANSAASVTSAKAKPADTAPKNQSNSLNAKAPTEKAVIEVEPAQKPKRAAKTAKPTPQPAEKSTQAKPGIEKQTARPAPLPTTEKSKIPARLTESQQKLKDAVLLLDAQFGKGFSAQNPALLVEYARIMATNEQTGTLRRVLSSLAEAFLKLNQK